MNRPDALDLGPIKPGLLAVNPPPKETYMRGKHARAAANRRAAADIETTEATYRQRVVKLTEERDAARAERDDAKAAWQKEVRILRAQLAEGTSPRVEALTREVERIRQERDDLKREKSDVRRRYGKMITRLRDHFVGEHGMTPPEAVDAIFSRLFGEAQHVTRDRIERKIADEFGAEVMVALRAARGEVTGR